MHHYYYYATTYVLLLLAAAAFQHMLVVLWASKSLEFGNWNLNFQFGAGLSDLCFSFFVLIVVVSTTWAKNWN